jgi:molecular chaperone DnaJ
MAQKQTEKQDYYKTLNVPRDVSPEALKKAYRKLAMTYHPDKNPGDQKAESTFKEISEAYEVLSDPQKRAAYDRMGHQAFEGGFGGGGQPGGFYSEDGGGFDLFEDMLDELMGGGRGRKRTHQGGAARGSDLQFDMEISLEDAFKGMKTEVKLPTLAVCGECKGSGAEKGSQPITCPTCKGKGAIRSQQGFFMMERTCPNCQGAGKTIANPCRSCSGSGRVQETKTLSVSIPAGVDTGSRLRMGGEGESGMRGGPAGDLYIFINIRPHPLFQREGRDMHCRVPISMVTAALGGTIEVPTIEGGRVRLSIPEGTQSGHKFRVKGKGMSVLKGTSRGDLYIHALVETPVHLTKKQKEVLAEFDASGDNDKSNPHATSFIAKVKSFWEGLKGS